MDKRQFVELWAPQVAKAARIGDWEPLIDYVENRMPITTELYEVLGEILKGELKRPNRRPPSSKIAQKSLGMAIAVALLKDKGQPTESAVTQISQEYRTSTRTVYRAM